MNRLESNSNRVHSGTSSEASPPQEANSVQERTFLVRRKLIPPQQSEASSSSQSASSASLSASVIHPLPENQPPQERHIALARELETLQPVNRERRHMGGFRDMAFYRVDMLNVDDETKGKLKATCGDLPAPGVRWDSPNNPTVIVWRGMRLQQLAEIASQGSIGQRADINISYPSEAEAIAQVGEQAWLPEFTLDPKVATSFAARNSVIGCVAIPSQYLTMGSGIERGVVCRPGAPMELLAWTIPTVR